MKTKLTLLAISAFFLFISCKEEGKTIELPLVPQKGYGHFKTSFGGIKPYSNKKDNPWKGTYLQFTKFPKGWKNAKYGSITCDIYQLIYQSYYQGKITKKWFENLKKSWSFYPDSLNFSKKPLKTQIGFAYQKDSLGNMQLIIDANNNLNLSDDTIISPPDFSFKKADSLANKYAIHATIEKYIEGKIKTVKVPLFVMYDKKYNMFFCNFPEYYTVNFENKNIEICPNSFRNLSYRDIKIAIPSDTIKSTTKFASSATFSNNEYFKIAGAIYKNLGINKRKNTLSLEKITIPQDKIYSTQVGYQAPIFKGLKFNTNDSLSLKNLRGKYVLLDFWSVYCPPCIKGLPLLKEIYDKTDRKNFEIIGVVTNVKEERLQKLLKDNEVTWSQILSTEQNNIQNRYNINYYPTTFLLDPNGIIIEKDLRGKKLEEKILELMK